MGHWKQDRNVNINEMGKVKGSCLINTRIACSPDVPSKYQTAHEAAQHAILHPGTPPGGVWVPVYFDFWVTVNGRYGNYGHVGWYNNGAFYSDGTKYSSIEAYRASGHTPNYIGWGELLNDVRIVEYVNDPAPAQPSGGRTKLHLDSGTITTTYDKNGSIYARDNTYDYRILVDEGFRVRVHSASVGGDCWIYLIYQTGSQKGQTIPGRHVS